MANTEDSEAYTIDKGIPLQPRLKRTLAFPLDNMEIGDSFVMLVIKRNNLTSALSQRRQSSLPGKFVTRRINDTQIRVWRVE